MKSLFVRKTNENKSNSKSSSSFDDIEDDDEELVLPNIKMTDPLYKKMCKDIKRYKKTNPSLYNSIMFWD